MFIGLGVTISQGATGAGSVPAPTVIVFDDFNRADSTTLGTATSGQVWSNIGFGVLNNLCYRVSGSPIASLAAGAADGALEFVEAAVGEAGLYYGAIFRRLTNSSYWRIVVQDTNFYLQRVNSGTTTIAVVPNVRAVGNIYRAVFIGDIIRIYANGVLKAQISDSLNSTQVSCGLVAASSANMRMDNLKVTG